jgi:hypothetical protein
MTHRNDHTTEGDPGSSRKPVWLRRELIIAGVFIPIGAIVLPIAIYMIGQSLLGTYSEQGYGIGRLYGDIFSDLAAGFPAAWILILSPWLALQLLRLAILPLRRHLGEDQPTG